MIPHLLSPLIVGKMSQMLPILHQSYWRDEAFSVLLSSQNLSKVLTLTTKDASPPLYYLLLHFWIRFFGDAEYVTRTLSLLFHFLLVLACFFLLQHFLKNWRVSLLGVLGILLNPFLIEYAFETRAYTLFAFLVAIAVLSYLKKKYLISSLFLALTILTHNFGIFFPIAFISFWFYENRSGLKKEVVKFLSAFGLPLLVLLGWMRFLWDQWVKVAEGFWIDTKTSAIFVDAFRAFFQGSTDYPSKAMFYNLSLVLIFLTISYWIARRVQKKSGDLSNKDGIFLVFIFSIPFLLTYVISTLWVPIFHERYLIAVLPLLIVWVAYSLNELCHLDKAFSSLVLAIVAAYVLFAVQSTEEILRITTKPAINYGVDQVLSKAKSGDVIVPESNLNFLETKYYVRKSGKNIPVLAHSPDKRVVFYIGSILFEEEEIISEYPKEGRVWVITPDGGHYLKTE